MQRKKIIEEIETECKRIEKLFRDYKPLLKKIEIFEPDFIEIGSLAMLLHSFYNGLENIFSRIARKLDGKIPMVKSGIKNYWSLWRNERRNGKILY